MYTTQVSANNRKATVTPLTAKDYALFQYQTEKARNALMATIGGMTAKDIQRLVADLWQGRKSRAEFVAQLAHIEAACLVHKKYEVATNLMTYTELVGDVLIPSDIRTQAWEMVEEKYPNAIASYNAQMQRERAMDPGVPKIVPDDIIGFSRIQAPKNLFQDTRFPLNKAQTDYLRTVQAFGGIATIYEHKLLYAVSESQNGVKVALGMAHNSGIDAIVRYGNELYFAACTPAMRDTAQAMSASSHSLRNTSAPTADIPVSVVPRLQANNEAECEALAAQAREMFKHRAVMFHVNNIGYAEIPHLRCYNLPDATQAEIVDVMQHLKQECANPVIASVQHNETQAQPTYQLYFNGGEYTERAMLDYVMSRATAVPCATSLYRITSSDVHELCAMVNDLKREYVFEAYQSSQEKTEPSERDEVNPIDMLTEALMSDVR